MDWKGVTEGVLRWIHVVAGIAWIGHLYFFNWVNAHFAPTMDAETKKKVVPELMPRALYWFRMGAAFTWITGFLLAGLVFYMSSGLMWASGAADWSAPSLVMLLLTWLGFLVYDQVFGKFKDQRVTFAVGLAAVAAVLAGMEYWAKWSFRGQAIHVGMLFGTTMAFNVWFRIWPAQQKIITAIKSGTAPDAALVAMAGARSKHNTYMSVPLVFAMLNAHQTWAASNQPWTFFAVVAVGWWLTFHLYAISKKVKGF
jgi:uncharacterized membrane protein